MRITDVRLEIKLQMLVHRRGRKKREQKGRRVCYRTGEIGTVRTTVTASDFSLPSFSR